MNGGDASRILRTLTCTVLSPGLNSILFWDPPSEAIETFAGVWAGLIAAAYNAKTETITLRPTETEETLWGNWGLAEKELVWSPGLFANVQSTIPIFLIPDVPLLELPIRRAIVTTVGEEFVHIERFGQSEVWRPRAFWLAGCRRSDVGQLSPHLLDRFPVRLHIAADESEADRLRQLQGAIWHTNRKSAEMERPAGLANARTRRPSLSDASLDRVLQLPEVNVSMRRLLAVTRLAVAVARLDNSALVQPEHVDDAANLIGIEPASPRPEMEDQTGSQPTSNEAISVSPNDGLENCENIRRDRAEETSRTKVEAIQADEPKPIANADTLRVDDGTVFPEDVAPVERESYSLRFATLPKGRQTLPRGAIIGSLPTANMHDLNLTATLFEAAKFRAIRRTRRRNNRLRIHLTDLRRNRRLPKPDHLLLLIIDYTAVSDLPWQHTLIPHLHDAYKNRASIAIVQVGAKDAPEPLRATLVRARNLLSPAVAHALSIEAGNATPLAHSFELAANLLRGNLHRGRHPDVKADVIVVTDGRGNVPLRSSIAGEISGSINREGIDDAIAAAARFRDINRLNIVVVSPTLTVCRRIPERLAAAMNARIAYIPPRYAAVPGDLRLEGER